MTDTALPNIGSTDQHQLAEIATALGLDPAESLSFSVEFKPGEAHARLTWTGHRRVPVEQALAAFGLADDDDAAGE